MITIGLTGPSGAGKDTVARVLEQRFRIATLSFAKVLKDELLDAFDADESRFFDPALKTVPTDTLTLRNCRDRDFCEFAWEIGHLAAVTPRTLMERWGDYRRAGNLNYFVERAEQTLGLYERMGGLDAVLITDVRFANEAQMLADVGGELWRVTRPGLVRQSHHRSQHELDNWPVDAEIVNDGSLEQLAKIATDLMLYALGRKEAA
jgi:hypothetical protein